MAKTGRATNDFAVVIPKGQSVSSSLLLQLVMNEIKDLDRKWCKLHVATKCSVDDYNMQITHLTYYCDKEEKCLFYSVLQ